MNQSNIDSLHSNPNESARQNDQVFQEKNENSLIQRFLKGQIIRISKKNLMKGVFLIIVIILAFWIASSFLNQTFIKQRTPFKFGNSLNNVEQIAGLDEMAYRSFYFYQKMVDHAKKNVKEGDTFQISELQQTQYKDIQFWELFGIFKVLKAIQLANGYDQSDDQENKKDEEQVNYDDVKNLTSPVNLTQYFSKAVDQAKCASCYSFPITATIQQQYAKIYGRKIKFSQQQLIDCSNPDEKANGCDEGNITRGFLYVKDNGLVQQGQYPYRSQGGKSYKCNNKIINGTTSFKIKDLKQLPKGDCKAIQKQLVLGNAVAALINTGRMNQIKNYSQPFRQCTKQKPNHAITIVGQTQNQDWIVRNSWSQSWGDNGYFIIRKGNTCGICNTGFVPILQVKEAQN